MKRIANIIISDKFVSLDPNYIASSQYIPPESYDSDSIKHVIRILNEKGFSVKLITYYNLLEKLFSEEEIFIVSQWLLNRFRETTSVLLDIKRKINWLSEQGNHFILMHHFWPYDVFDDVLDIGYYQGNKRGYFKDRLTLLIKDDHRTIYGVQSFIENNSDKFKSDEFTFQFKDNGKFRVLVQKYSKSREPKNFISFGYQKNNNSYTFLIDVHNIGETPTHGEYFDLLFRNTISFLLRIPMHKIYNS